MTHPALAPSGRPDTQPASSVLVGASAPVPRGGRSGASACPPTPPVRIKTVRSHLSVTDLAALVARRGPGRAFTAAADRGRRRRRS
jgi:hypothetical protein